MEIEYLLVAIAGLLSWFALKEKAFLLGLIAGAAWLVTMAYVAGNPPVGLVAGDTVHSMLLIVLIGAAISVPLVAMRLQRGKDTMVGGTDYNDSSLDRPPRFVAQIKESRSMRHGVASNFNESPEEYQARIHRMLHPKRSRR